MNSKEIKRPIGLATPCKEIESTCSRAHMYRRCGLRPAHFVIPLDPGSGRTTLVEYMADKYKEAGVLSFSSGLDDYIEIVFDGTLQQLKQAFSSIDSAAVYTNEYCNIISMDISNISMHLGETQFTEFIRSCKKVCEHACVIFFVHADPGRNEEKLLAKLCESIGNIKRLEVEPYTADDICSLIIKAVTEHGVEIEREKEFRAAMLMIVSEFCITSVKDAITTADTLVRYADFSGFTPVADVRSLNLMITSWHNDAGRSEVK